MNKTLIALLFAAATTAHAGYYDDSRIRQVISNELTPIGIEFVVGQPLIIELPNDQPISDVAFSGLDDWRTEYEVNKKGNRLFVKAIDKSSKPRTILITAAEHSYVLDLAPSRKAVPLSKLIIKNAAPVTAEPEIFAHAKIEEKDKIIGDGIKVLKPADVNNRNYSMQIVKQTVDIRPREAWDDGRFTYLRFPNNIAFPTAYRSVPGTKEEALVSYHVENKDVLVLHGISPLWNLRLGQSVIGVYNEKYDAVGAATPDSTTNGAVRELK